MNNLSIRKPDDWHIHLREGDMLAMTIQHASKNFGRVLAMPNLQQPLINMQRIAHYYQQIQLLQPKIKIYCCLYLTEETTRADIKAISKDDRVKAVKWYPAGATTNSSSGVTNIERCFDLLELMEEIGVVLSIHGEVTDSKVDIFHREAVFIDQVLDKIRSRFPKLRIVMEHISTSAAVEYVSLAESEFLAATITSHHLFVQRNDILVGGIKPHLYCLPIAKKESDRQALLAAATSGKSCFFLGTDSAPHDQYAKESACGCAGCYIGDFAILLYAMAFDKIGQLEKLENFASVFGARYYGLEPSEETIHLTRREQLIPRSYSYSYNKKVVPFFAGTMLSWSVQ